MGNCPEMHHLYRAAKWLGVAPWELAAQSEFDHVVINDEVARCAHEVLDLIQA